MLMKKSLLFAALTLFAVGVNATETQNVTYVDANGVEQTIAAYPITEKMDSDVADYNDFMNRYELKSGWYVVDGNVTTSALGAQDGNVVNIILADGSTLGTTCLSCSNATLNLYVQSKGTGKVMITNEYNDITAYDNSTINVYGGNYSGQYSVFNCQSGGTFHIYDATASGAIKNYAGKMIFEGGTFTCNDGVALYVYSETIVNGGTFTGAEHAFMFSYYYDDDWNEIPLSITLGEGKAWYSNGVKVDMDDMEQVKVDDQGDEVFFYSKLATYTVQDAAVPTVLRDINATSSKAVKTIENGQLVIIKDGNRYNVAGQLLK